VARRRFLRSKWNQSWRVFWQFLETAWEVDGETRGGVEIGEELGGGEQAVVHVCGRLPGRMPLRVF
jgi:hypothetical protein